jgi:glycerol dehydrogenase
MNKVFISPLKYVQGKDALVDIGQYVLQHGQKALLVAADSTLARVQDKLDAALEKNAFELIQGGFCGECTSEEIARLAKLAEEKACSVIIGLGGGKALDTAKAIANPEFKPLIIVPTIASTDAPCSSAVVVYKADGEFDEYRWFKKNPNVVLVDTDIIAKAPVRFLISGMGDALSTYFEARSCERSFANNIPGGKSTKLAVAAAELCYDILMEDSLKAIAACKNGVVTPALENII